MLMLCAAYFFERMNKADEDDDDDGMRVFGDVKLRDLKLLHAHKIV